MLHDTDIGMNKSSGALNVIYGVHNVVLYTP